MDDPDPGTDAEMERCYIYTATQDLCSEANEREHEYVDRFWNANTKCCACFEQTIVTSEEPWEIFINFSNQY